MCDALWCHTTAEGAAMIWAALIGLVGAGGAIVGAVLVGLRQSTILEQQTHIQRAQAKLAETALDLEHLKVRSDLFDRRFSVYQAVRNWLIWTEENERPPGAKPETLEGDLYEDFQRARDLSRFVFPSNVHNEIEAMRVMGNKIAGVMIMMEESDVVGPHIEEHVRLMRDVRAYIGHLGDLFGDDMNLTVFNDKVGKAARGETY